DTAAVGVAAAAGAAELRHGEAGGAAVAAQAADRKVAGDRDADQGGSAGEVGQAAAQRIAAVAAVAVDALAGTAVAALAAVDGVLADEDGLEVQVPYDVDPATGGLPAVPAAGAVVLPVAAHPALPP